MDPSRGVPRPKSKSRSRGPSAAAPSTAQVKAKTYAKNSVSVVTKSRRAPSSQPRKEQQVLSKQERFDAKVCHYREEKSPKHAPMKKVPEPSLPKCVPEPDSDKEEEEDADDDEESNFQLEDLSVSDEEREVVIRNARKRLRQLLAETTFLVDELDKTENDVQRLQDEKEGLLEQLFAREGFAVDPYPRFRPLTRKIKLLWTKL